MYRSLSRKKDYRLKFMKYSEAGMREYWIVDIKKERITVYQFEEEDYQVAIYTFSDQIPVGIFEELKVDFTLAKEGMVFPGTNHYPV